MKTPVRLFVSLCCVASLVACSKTEPAPQGPRPAVVMTVGDKAGANMRVYSGEVRARHEADLSFRIGGKIIERNFNLGDRVRKGQVLARLDPQDVRLSASAAQAQVAAAEADVALATAEFERARNLQSQKFISASALDTRRTQLEAAQARLRQAKAQAGVTANQIAYAVLTADRDGVVTLAPMETGQVVAAGQPVARVADPQQTEILAWVPESRIGSIKVGQAVLVRPWNDQEKTLPGSVREIAASADAVTRTYAIRVAMAQPDASLTLGSTAAVAFPEAAEGLVSVPLQALVSKGQSAQVWVVDAQNTVQPRAVAIESYRDDAAVIRSGLAHGERIVTVGAHALGAGMKIRPVAAQSPVVLDVKR